MQRRDKKMMVRARSQAKRDDAPVFRVGAFRLALFWVFHSIFNRKG